MPVYNHIMVITSLLTIFPASFSLPHIVWMLDCFKPHVMSNLTHCAFKLYKLHPFLWLYLYCICTDIFSVPYCIIMLLRAICCTILQFSPSYCIVPNCTCIIFILLLLPSYLHDLPLNSFSSPSLFQKQKHPQSICCKVYPSLLYTWIVPTLFESHSALLNLVTAHQ